jgi:zinc/manganese transport system substrate-binding protein
MQKLSKIAIIAALAVVVIAAGAYEVLSSKSPSNPCAGFSSTSANSTVSATPTEAAAGFHASGQPRAGVTPSDRSRADIVTGTINVVAAENFWGSLVAQLGGNRTAVTSIVTDPNTDPHEYEANTSTAVAITNAQYIIVNGVGYDDWALSIIAADGKGSSQLVLNVGDLNGVSVTGDIVTGNPHMWYNPIYVNTTVAAMYSDLVTLQPSSAAYFQANYASLNSSLAQLYARATEIRNQFAGTVVASTESIFVYLANYTHLDLISPPEFMKAIAEGNDPPAQSVIQFQCQLESGTVKVLIYNEQTVTPITTNLKTIAAEHNITIVGVTETIQPPGVNFQTWMFAQYLQLQNALNANALGQ